MFDSVISNVVNIEKINDSDLRLLGVVFNGRVWYVANFKWQKLVKNRKYSISMFRFAGLGPLYFDVLISIFHSTDYGRPERK